MNEGSIALDPRVCVRRDDGSVLIRVKAVPGSSRDQIVGVLGDRLKVKVAAPPEGGAANRAICAAIEASLGVRRGVAEVVSGQRTSVKSVLCSPHGASES